MTKTYTTENPLILLWIEKCTPFIKTPNQNKMFDMIVDKAIKLANESILKTFYYDLSKNKEIVENIYAIPEKGTKEFKHWVLIEENFPNKESLENANVISNLNKFADKNQIKRHSACMIYNYQYFLGVANVK